ncbi:tigger transposable element-derived protein 4-like [Penaeus indicus]|uniref:tigger transposable element-derived protein 4-like n=1 Tax=Penaeus indicus TaxID=29960 RepID=UPI00300D565A
MAGFRSWRKQYGVRSFKEDIFNADETALYYRALPRRTLELNHAGATGYKISKERLTVLLCSSASGEKLPMRMISQRRNILLFVDNAPPHRNVGTFTNVRIEYLPPNSTAMTQPMDQGIIWSLKCKYRKRLLEFLLPTCDPEKLPSCSESFHLLQAMRFLKAAWDNVHPNTIINGFVKARFFSQPELADQSNDNCNLIEDFHKYVALDEELFALEVREIDLDNDSDEVSGLIHFVVTPKLQEFSGVDTDTLNPIVHEPERSANVVSQIDAEKSVELLKSYILFHPKMPIAAVDHMSQIGAWVAAEGVRAAAHRRQSKISEFWN